MFHRVLDRSLSLRKVSVENTFYYGKKIEKKIGTFKAKAFVEYFR